VEAKGPIIGFINELDQKIAILNGNTASPEFGVPTDSIAGLEGDWADGQVYRFAPYSSPTKELLDESKISISPNPCSDLLQIHSKNEINGLKADIFDIFGRLVLTQTIHDNAQINVSSLPPGAYFIQINGHKQFHKQAFSKI
jgi:hypothetical protein